MACTSFPPKRVCARHRREFEELQRHRPDSRVSSETGSLGLFPQGDAQALHGALGSAPTPLRVEEEQRDLHPCECGKTLVALGHSGLSSFLTRGSLPAHLASPCQWTVSGSDRVEHGRVGRVLQVPPSVVRNAETPCGGGSREDTVAWIAESHQRTVVPACLGISLLP